jgi:hypothetical protein
MGGGCARGQAAGEEEGVRGGDERAVVEEPGEEVVPRDGGRALGVPGVEGAEVGGGELQVFSVQFSGKRRMGIIG